MPEQIKQSLESQLQMARPRCHEVKRVPLTPEEKEFLGEIMDKAVAAEKAGELKKALDLYTDYKNELLKIKKKLSFDKDKWDEETVLNWVKEEIDASDPRKWMDKIYLRELPVISINQITFDLSNIKSVKHLPNNLIVRGTLNLRGTSIEKLPNALTVHEDLYLQNTPITTLPDNIYIHGKVYISKENKKLLAAAKEAQKRGDINGQIIEA